MKKLLLLILRKHIINMLYIKHGGQFIDNVLKSLNLNELSINEAEGFDKLLKTPSDNRDRMPLLFKLKQTL